MSGFLGRFRRLLGVGGGDGEQNAEQRGQDDENPDSEPLERQPKWSQHSGTSSTYLELPKGRSRETSSLRTPAKRKPRPVHRSATDTARGSGQSGDGGDLEGRPVYPSSVLESNSEEESSTARLSRRPSVLIDLIALFRRSSSFGYARRPSRRYHQHDEEDSDDLDDENEENAKMSKEKILASIRRKKQDLSRLPSQPWNMQRKRRMLKVAKRYLQRQQAKVNRWNLWSEEFQRRIVPQCKRWFKNIRTYLIPFESRIKRIESHFGSVVSSYFTFLRWILFLNVLLTAIIVLFIVIPEWLVDGEGNPKRLRDNEHIKVMPEEVRKTADELKTILDFGGYMQYSYIFYGFYSKDTIFRRGPFSMKVPVAYFVVNLFLLLFSLFLILRKMASNARNSKIQGGRTEQYVFTWKIGNSETAASLYKSNVTKLKEAIADYNVKLKKKWTPGRIARVVVVNVVILLMIGLTGWGISEATSINKDTFLKQNAVSIIVSFVTLVFPNLFELIGHFEGHHPRTALRWHLARVFLLYIVAYYSLFGSLYSLLDSMQKNHTETVYYYPTNQPFTIVYNPNSAREKKAFLEHQRRKYRNRHFRQLNTSWFAANAYNNPNATEAPEFTKPPLFTFTTTAEPPKPWTTVQSNFGPFAVGVSNPKVLVVSDKKLQKQVPNTVYESRPIGPLGDWNDATTQRPTPLYFPTSPRQQYAKYSKGYMPGGGICWETQLGQEIVKVVITDLIMTVFIVLIIDFLRGLWVRYCALIWCWDLEGMFPEYDVSKNSCQRVKREFENVLHLIKDQTMVWLGTLFVPFLPAINILKLVVLMYLRGWAVMTCNIPARQIFRASRSNNFYLILLLLMFLFSTIPVGYVIASIPPSKGCGPFAGQPHFYTVIIQSLKNTLNGKLVGFIEGIMSPGLIIPILLFLLLVIYFMFALIRGLHDANHELEEQLTMERTEEKRRIFELAGGGRKRHQAGTNGVQIPKASPEKGGKVNSSPQRSLKSPTSLDDFPHHSPSKSPISPRAANRSFLPSLQSLKEDDDNAEDEEEETREPQPTDQLLRRESSPSTVQHRPEVRYDELPPVRMNWKQRLLVLIGVLDRDKVEAKLRMRQLAEVAYANDREDEEEEEKERKRSLPLKHRDDDEEDTTSAPVQNEKLEEASSSTNGELSEPASSEAGVQRNIPARMRTPMVGTPTGRPPSRSPWSRGGSRGTGGTDEDTGPAELLTIINTGQPPSRMGSATPHRSTPPVQPQRAPSQRRAQRAGTTASSSPWLEGEQPRRSFSMNNPRHLQPPLERDLVSESSPLMERRSADVLESHRLSPEKRSPPSAPMRKRSSGSGIREFSLDPTPMVYDGNYWDHPHISNRMQLSDEATRPPSEETSFRDPTPSRSEDAQRQVQSPYSDFQDDRLAYANPYSSYAAAMASPLMPDNLENDPFVQRLRQTSALSATPEPPNFRAVPVDPFAAYNAPPLQNPQPYYMTPMTPLTPTFSPVRPRNAARFSSLQPPTPQLQSARAAPQQFFAPPFAGPDAYVTPAPAIYSPYRSPQQRTPLPIYPSGYGTEPRFSSDPRNTSPSGGYQSGNSPTPDIGSPRFRISTSPPRRMRPTYLSEEADSGRGSGNQSDPSVRRWDLRQRGTITSTDDSTSPERSPSRQPHGSFQTTV